jgi:ABC-type amino acid transport substrate-binding protein
MSGIRATPERAKIMQFSQPYAEETAAFLVRDYLRHDFGTIEKIIQRPQIKVAVLNMPSWIQRLKHLLPNARIVTVLSTQEFIHDRGSKFDAMYTGWERAAALSLIHPEFTPVIPEPGLGKFPLAYAVPKYEEDLLSMVNTWVVGRQSSGQIQKELEYWVHGKGRASVQTPRWSIAENIFRWF